jgi:signal peptidase I
VSRTVSWLLTLALVAGWWALLRPSGLADGPVTMLAVRGTSMEPVMHTGDMVLLYDTAPYDVGDVIAYRVPEGGNVIHRVTDVEPDGGYVTIGDNRTTLDPWRPTDGDVLGRQVALLPQAATHLARAAEPFALAVLAGGTTLLLLLRRPPDSPDSTGSTQTEDVRCAP